MHVSGFNPCIVREEMRVQNNLHGPAWVQPLKSAGGKESSGIEQGSSTSTSTSTCLSPQKTILNYQANYKTDV